MISSSSRSKSVLAELHKVNEKLDWLCEQQGQLNEKVDRLSGRLGHVNEKLDVIMVSQSDLDALAQSISDSLATLSGVVADQGTQSAAIATDVTAIQALLAAGQNGTLDITALSAAVASLADNAAALTASQASLDTAVGTVTDLVPPAPSA